jgi:hypothetical protein
MTPINDPLDFMKCIATIPIKKPTDAAAPQYFLLPRSLGSKRRAIFFASVISVLRSMRFVNHGAFRTLACSQPDRAAKRHADRHANPQPDSDMSRHHSEGHAQGCTQRSS